MKKVDQDEQHNTLVASVSTHDDKINYKTEKEYHWKKKGYAQARALGSTL